MKKLILMLVLISFISMNTKADEKQDIKKMKEIKQERIFPTEHKIFYYEQSNDTKPSKDLRKYSKLLAKAMKKNPNWSLHITTHSDGLTNDIKKEQEISEKRAKEFLKLMMKLGIKKTRIETESSANQNPESNNSDFENQKRNRRIELKIIN